MYVMAIVEGHNFIVAVKVEVEFGWWFRRGWAESVRALANGSDCWPMLLINALTGPETCT